MTDPVKLLLAPALAGALLLTGCIESHDEHDHEEHTETEAHDEHDHEEHAETEARVNGVADTHDTDHGLGQVEIADSVLTVSIGGEPAPNVTLHLDLELKSGPTPAAIRVWVGDETATGSVKGKAFGSGGDYHADATCPADLEEADVLWIELESSDGTRHAGSLPLD